VTGHFFYRMFGLSATSSDIDEHDAHLFCNCHFPTTPASDAEERAVDYAFARSISAARSPSSNTPLLIRESLHL
jgi:hypothetical protein